MYYYIEDDYQKGDIVVKSMKNSESIFDSLISGGETDLKEVTIDISPKNGKKKDFLMTESVVLPFVSKKVKDILEGYEFEKMQFISTNLDDYFLLHIKQPIKCLDWDKSDCEKHPPFLKEISHLPKKIKKLVFIENEIDSNLFRMLEEPVTLFISKKLKNIFEENNVTGLKYIDINNYTKGVY